LERVRGSDGVGVKISPGLLCAADVPPAPRGDLVAVVLAQLCPACRVGVGKGDMFKPNGLFSPANAADREITMGASEGAEIHGANFKRFHR